VIEALTIHHALLKLKTLSIVINMSLSRMLELLVKCSSRRMDGILDNVHDLIASQLSPGQAAVGHATPSLGEARIHKYLLVVPR
jgi:hypothetical protein